MAGLLLKAHSDPSVVAQLAEQALDDVALFVELPIARALLDTVALGRDHCLDLTNLQPLQELIDVIAFVDQQRRRADPLHESDRLGDICRLTSRKYEANRQSQRISQRMYLVPQATSRLIG
nr:hypothetical protein [Pseudomonas benzenivorans]